MIKLRNMKEVDAFIEENSAMVDKKRLYDMYQQAVNYKPYSFFFIKKCARRTLTICFI